jgi:hypothetical protein
MADNNDDVVEDLRRQADAQIEQLEQRGIVVPTGVDEDEAMHSVQQQLADAGFDSDAYDARHIVREARRRPAASGTGTQSALPSPPGSRATRRRTRRRMEDSPPREG